MAVERGFDVQGEYVVLMCKVRTKLASEQVSISAEMSKKVLRIRVHGTLMTVTAAVFTAMLKPHDQGICPFPNERLTIAHSEAVLG